MKQVEENITTSTSSKSQKTKKSSTAGKKKSSAKKDSTSKKDKKAKKVVKKEATDSVKTVDNTTITTDTLATDSIFYADSLYCDSTAVRIDSTIVADTATIEVPPPYMSGNEPALRNNHPGHDTGLMILLSVTFLLVAFNFNSYRRMLKTFGQDLWNVRRRANAFDEHTTNERSLIAVLIFQLCVYAGILISAKMNTIIPLSPEKTITATYSMIGVYGVYYIFQLISYSLVGYTFADGINSSQWVKGFNASHIFLGFALIIPTVASIFYPTTSSTMWGIAVSLYVIARLLFIFKGFRIFYQKIHSLFYFILYLCTLEIIPVIFMYGISQIIFTNLQ